MITIKTEDGRFIDVPHDLFYKLGEAYYATDLSTEQVMAISGLDSESEANWDLFWDCIDAYRVEHEL